MPGPPPKGASSTPRCLSRANSRMSTVFQRPKPCLQGLAGQGGPQRPGQHLGEEGEHRGPATVPGSPQPSSISPGGGSATRRRPARSTRGAASRVKGSTKFPPALDAGDVEQRARPVIQDRRHPSQRTTVDTLHPEPDQIVMVELVLGRRRQGGSGHEQAPADERRGACRGRRHPPAPPRAGRARATPGCAATRADRPDPDGARRGRRGLGRRRRNR